MTIHEINTLLKMTDPQRTRPEAPPPNIRLPFGNPCREENVQRAYSIERVRELIEFKPEIPNNVLTPEQVDVLAAYMFVELSMALHQVHGAVTFNMNAGFAGRVMARTDLRELQARGEHDGLDMINQRLVLSNEQLCTELSNPEVIGYFKNLNQDHFHDQYMSPYTQGLIARITAVDDYRDLPPMLNKFHVFCMYAQHKDIHRLTGTLIKTLDKLYDAIEWAIKTTPYACACFERQLLSITANYRLASRYQPELAPPEYTELPNDVDHLELRPSRYQFIVDHARQYGRVVGRRRMAFDVIYRGITLAVKSANPPAICAFETSEELLGMIIRLVFPI